MPTITYNEEKIMREFNEENVLDELKSHIDIVQSNGFIRRYEGYMDVRGIFCKQEDAETVRKILDSVRIRHATSCSNQNPLVENGDVIDSEGCRCQP